MKLVKKADLIVIALFSILIVILGIPTVSRGSPVESQASPAAPLSYWNVPGGRIPLEWGGVTSLTDDLLPAVPPTSRWGDVAMDPTIRETINSEVPPQPVPPFVNWGNVTFDPIRRETKLVELGEVVTSTGNTIRFFTTYFGSINPGSPTFPAGQAWRTNFPAAFPSTPRVWIQWRALSANSMLFIAVTGETTTYFDWATVNIGTGATQHAIFVLATEESSR